MTKFIFYFAAAILFFNCSGIKRATLNHRLSDLEKEFNHHVGLSIYDPLRSKMVYEFNGSRYFTPASNTKILTFYTCLKSLPDSLTTFFFKEKGDSLLLWPAGDPTFLNPEFPSSQVPQVLRETDKLIYISFSNSSVESFGPGWAWEDFPYTFSSERAAMPVFGNYYTLRSGVDSLSITIPYFKRHLWLSDSIETAGFIRESFSNDVFYFPGTDNPATQVDIPFRTSEYLSTWLLSDTLGRPVFITNEGFDTTAFTLKSILADTAYKKMMQESNNFVAEQLLLQCAAIVIDTMDQERMIKYAIENYLGFLPQKPVWVDGSGLSRYNLITPNSLTALWAKIYSEYGGRDIFPLLATGGRTGTLENYYMADPPYIFGKTGTLRNNHNLSGYMITKKGKILIFSFMNNNYPTASVPVKKRMEEILWEIHLDN